MKNYVLSPLSFLSLLVLSGLLSACPEKEKHLNTGTHQEHHLNAGPHEVAVFAADDLGIPCSLDLGGMLTQEKMQRFNPEVQRLLYRAERIACRFYDRLAQEGPWECFNHENIVNAFDRQYMGEQDFVKLQNAYTSPLERRLAAAEFIDVVKQSLEHHFPKGAQCIEDTVSALNVALESKSHDEASNALLELAYNKKNCDQGTCSDRIEVLFFSHAVIGLSESAYLLFKHHK